MSVNRSTLTQISFRETINPTQWAYERPSLAARRTFSGPVIDSKWFYKWLRWKLDLKVCLHSVVGSVSLRPTCKTYVRRTVDRRTYMLFIFSEIYHPHMHVIYFGFFLILEEMVGFVWVIRWACLPPIFISTFFYDMDIMDNDLFAFRCPEARTLNPTEQVFKPNFLLLWFDYETILPPKTTSQTSSKIYHLIINSWHL